MLTWSIPKIAAIPGGKMCACAGLGWGGMFHVLRYLFCRVIHALRWCVTQQPGKRLFFFQPAILVRKYARPRHWDRDFVGSSRSSVIWCHTNGRQCQYSIVVGCAWLIIHRFEKRPSELRVPGESSVHVFSSCPGVFQPDFCLVACIGTLLSWFMVDKVNSHPSDPFLPCYKKKRA